MLTNLPNMLTIFRVVVVPLLVVLFYIGGATAIWTAVVIFALAGASDYLDGYFARTMKQTSDFGRFLDPIADKLIVIVSLMLVIGFGHLQGYWILAAIIIVAREIMVSGLREFLGPYKITVPVTKLAKWKTTVQMLFLGFLIAGPYGPTLVPYAEEIGRYGLVLAAIVTVITGWDYMKSGYKTVKELDS